MDYNFVNDTKGLNIHEYNYLKKIFESNLKVGVEFELEDANGDFDSCRELERKLEAKQRYDTFGFGGCGVANVHHDGSLDDGVEVVTRGRYFVDPMLFHAQYKKIFETVGWDDVEVSPRTGMHQHICLATGSNGENGGTNLERPLPFLMVKNLVILVKKYLPELLFSTSAIYKEGSESITRYNGFSRYSNLWRNSINTYKTYEDMAYIVMSGERYQVLNINPIGTKNIDDVEQISDFHVEFRLADGCICPSQAVIQSFMYRALILLALDCSLLGELIDESGEEEKSFINKFKNNPSGNNYPDSEGRYSNNTLSEQEMLVLVNRSKAFADVLKPYLSEDMYKATSSMCEVPISIRLKDGMSFREIDEDLNTFTKPSGRISNTELLRKVVKLHNLESLQEVSMCAKESGVDIEEIVDIIGKLKMIKTFNGRKF